MGTEQAVDMDALSEMLRASKDASYGVETIVDGITFKSQLEAAWYETFRDETRLQVFYEPIRYRREIVRDDGVSYFVKYTPDFVLAPQGRKVRVGKNVSQSRYRGLVHVECKPTVQEPENLLQIVSDPVVLLCGYPDDRPQAYVVESKLEFRGRKRWELEYRAYHMYGGDWKQAVIDAATGDWRQRRSVRRIGA